MLSAHMPADRRGGNIMKQETKVVIVTGASGGIGAAIVKKFYDNGYSVAMFDINEAALKAVAADLGLDEARAAIQPVDITAEEQVIAAIAAVKERFGKIDALINVAAIIGEYGLTCDCTLENFKNIYNVNVFGTFAMMKHTLPIMLEQKHGNIVNFGSVSGMSGYTCEIGYGSSKWAVIGMTKNVANEYGQYGIRSNSISPGWVNTAMFRKSVEDFADMEDASITLGPLGRPAEPYEMADIVYFMCQPEANFLNGSNVLADGGMMLG